MSQPELQPGVLTIPPPDSEPRSYVHDTPASISGYSRPSSVSPDDRDKVTQMALAGRRCVITHRQSNLECVHILCRTTSVEDQIKLASCWGIKPTDLDLNAPDNIMWLTPNMHSFDKSQWALVPPLSLLLSITTKLLRKECRPFTELHPSKRNWEYNFAQLVSCPDTITCEDQNPPIIHYSPYTTLPTITSHVHPYYVICNVARKDKKYHKQFDEATSGHYPTFSKPSDQTDQADLSQRIQTCRVIYDTWMREKLDTPTHLAPPSRSTRSAGSTRSDGSTQEHSSPQSERRLKRARTIDANNAASTLRAREESGQQYEAQESDVTDSASTPGGPWTVADDVHIYDTYSRLAVIPLQSKVRKWLAEQDQGEPCSVEESLGISQFTEDPLTLR